MCPPLNGRVSLFPLFSGDLMCTRSAEAPINRVEDQFDAIVNAELIVDIREMVLHCVLADVELRCYIFVGLAIYESPDNLHLPASQTQTCNFRFRSPKSNRLCRRSCL